jgi:hypothetical protein
MYVDKYLQHLRMPVENGALKSKLIGVSNSAERDEASCKPRVHSNHQMQGPSGCIRPIYGSGKEVGAEGDGWKWVGRG